MSPESGTQSDSASSSRRTTVMGAHQRQASRTRRGYVKAALLLFLALLAGVVIGVSGTFIYVKQKMHKPPPKADQIGKSILERMSKHVDLSADEKTRIEAIIKAHMEAVETARRETFTQIRNEFDSMNDQIDEILGPERSDKWEADKKERYGKMYRPREERHVGPSRREPPRR